ncbi:MAG: hypothetical protein A3K25_03160 [Planctomycetes bacterium RIFOXYB12_FULL_42_10]|nr:MAG: hypothetical protein A3J92_07320 [Planctomycetes bacterium RIFOXYC2_FULL_41_27]OHC19234.1 MAG: hypothetical protein A3K25_03160 [Planctomycetes bacterium RIFOXYB12_FULL_42_10]
MRESRLYGSEGGGGGKSLPYPLSKLWLVRAKLVKQSAPNKNNNDGFTSRLGQMKISQYN